jgi:hypothetical protein
MSKRDDLIAKYAAALKAKTGSDPDMALLTKVTIGCGPAIYNQDSETIAASDPSEVERVRTNFLVKKLGLPDTPDLKAAIEATFDAYGRSDRNKYRPAIYYMLVKHFGKESVYA